MQQCNRVFITAQDGMTLLGLPLGQNAITRSIDQATLCRQRQPLVRVGDKAQHNRNAINPLMSSGGLNVRSI